MSKLFCKCGNIIADNADNLSYKADLLPDKLFYHFFDQLDVSVSQFIEECEGGGLKQLLLRYMHSVGINNIDKEPIDDILHHTVTKYIFDISKQVYQCERCNRIWIQKSRTEEFVSFIPEGDSRDNCICNILE